MVTTPFSGGVAAVIPVSRAASLSDTLDSVLLQSRPPDDVVVVDRGSEPELVRRAIAPHADRVVVVRERHGGLGVARNAGIVGAPGQPWRANAWQFENPGSAPSRR